MPVKSLRYYTEPAGILRKTRANGDQLFYHPETNTFAARTKTNTPETFFKPKKGSKYWGNQ